MKITIIGCGKMGSGIARRLAKKEHEIALYDHHPETTKKLALETGAIFCDSGSEAVALGDIIFIAVKPQDLKKVAEEINRDITDKQLIISVLAGVNTIKLGSHFTRIPILRIIPNLPAIYGEGIIGAGINKNLSEEWVDKIEVLLKPLGHLHWFPEEQLNALTSITASGPAFLYVIFESIVDAGIKMGFTLPVAKTIAMELFKGATQTLENSSLSPSELKWEITSPAGTTISGIQVLEEHGVRAGIINTFLASYKKAQEMEKMD